MVPFYSKEVMRHDLYFINSNINIFENQNINIDFYKNFSA